MPIDLKLKFLTIIQKQEKLISNKYNKSVLVVTTIANIETIKHKILEII